MTVHEFSVNSQQSTTLMWNNLFFGVPLVQRSLFIQYGSVKENCRLG
ncbi:hypothetical protein [Nostoc sphaeroides]|nr:hypothetical protein [Nostoc sphaeroides]